MQRVIGSTNDDEWDNGALIQTLPEGPIDMIGDVHGEYRALCRLLGHLGYDEHGGHHDGRRLVFVGDLVDRGPLSVSVLRLVRRLIEARRAKCILGNHELNLLRVARKDGNAWFHGDREDHGRPAFDEVLDDEPARRETLAFLGRLPLALERSDVRVVHACWDDASVEALRSGTRAIDEFRRHERALQDAMALNPAPDALEAQLVLQNRNPVKVLTSGFERRHAGFMHNGRVRSNQRVPWWNQYGPGRPFCVFGHYNRLNDPDNEAFIFSVDDVPHEPLGAAGNCMCIDLGAGWRSRERRMGRTRGFVSRLAALRWPEGEIVDDLGRRVHMPMPERRIGFPQRKDGQAPIGRTP